MARRSPTRPVTEGEVLTLHPVSSIPVTENPEATLRHWGIADKNTPFIQDPNGNALRIPTLKTFETTSPTVNDDKTKGFIEGSIWVKTSTDFIYMCVDASTGAAIWLRMKGVTFDDINDSESVLWKADPATGPSEVLTGDLIAFELPHGAEKAVVADFLIPERMDFTTNPRLIWGFVPRNGPDVPGNARFRLQVRYIAETELTTKAIDETIITTEAVIDTNDRIHLIGESPGNEYELDGTKMAQNDYIGFKLTRLGNDVLDTYQKDTAIIARARLDFATV